MIYTKHKQNKNALFVMRYVLYVFIDSEYHKIYFTDYFLTFYGQ